jgi:hypothetical protein
MDTPFNSIMLDLFPIWLCDRPQDAHCSGQLLYVIGFVPARSTLYKTPSSVAGCADPLASQKPAAPIKNGLATGAIF